MLLDKYSDDAQESPRPPPTDPFEDALKFVVPDLTVFNPATGQKSAEHNLRPILAPSPAIRIEDLLQPSVPDLSVLNLEPMHQIKNDANRFGSYKSYTSRLQETKNKLPPAVTKPVAAYNSSPDHMYIPATISMPQQQHNPAPIQSDQRYIQSHVHMGNLYNSSTSPNQGYSQTPFSYNQQHVIPQGQGYNPNQEMTKAPPQYDQRNKPFILIAPSETPPRISEKRQRDENLNQRHNNCFKKDDPLVQQLTDKIETLQKDKNDLLNVIDKLTKRLEAVEKHTASCCSKPITVKSTVETGVQCDLPLDEFKIQNTPPNPRNNTKAHNDTDVTDCEYPHSSPKWINKPLDVQSEPCEVVHNPPFVDVAATRKPSAVAKLSRDYESRRPLLEDTALSRSNVSYLHRYCLVGKNDKIVDNTPHESPIGRQFTPIRTPNKSPFKRFGIADRVLDAEFIKNQPPFPDLR